MDAAESIEKLTQSMPKATAAAVAAAVTRVYEACSFQDITGQRIGKVVTTLKYIEAKIDALLTAFGDAAAAASASAPAVPLDENARLMQGPQLPAKANRQAEIDAILGSLDER